MALYRIVAGFGDSFELPNTEGEDSSYVNTNPPYIIDYYDPLPPIFVSQETVPTAPDYSNPVVNNNSFQEVYENNTGGTFADNQIKTIPTYSDPVDTPGISLPKLVPIDIEGSTPIPIDTLPKVFPVTNSDIPTPLPLANTVTTTIKNNLFPVAILAGLAVIAVKGDDLLGAKRKLAFLGGLGLFYYLMAKNQPT